MRTTRQAPFVAAALALLLGGSVAAVTPMDEVDTLPVSGVSGTATLDAPGSFGDFSVDEGVFEYRSVPVIGSELVTDDARLNGDLDSTWNWDIHPSGSQPVPAWGMMQISAGEEGAWEGTFTGIRRADGEPFMVRAFLFGQGDYEGLCATLDIEAGTDAWAIDGVVHRVETPELG